MNIYDPKRRKTDVETTQEMQKDKTELVELFGKPKRKLQTWIRPHQDKIYVHSRPAAGPLPA